MITGNAMKVKWNCCHPLLGNKIERIYCHYIEVKKPFFAPCTGLEYNYSGDPRVIHNGLLAQLCVACENPKKEQQFTHTFTGNISDG